MVRFDETIQLILTLLILILCTPSLACALTLCNAPSITPCCIPSDPLSTHVLSTFRLICSVGLYHIASSLFPDTSMCCHRDGDGNAAQGENTDGSDDNGD